MPLSHDETTCICRRCTAIRENAWWEANRPRRLPAEDVAGELLRLRSEGATYRELAEKTGLALGTVHRIVRGGVSVDPATQGALASLRSPEAKEERRGLEGADVSSSGDVSRRRDAPALL
jgi:winged helix-turn-helix DNA-binding protein